MTANEIFLLTGLVFLIHQAVTKDSAHRFLPHLQDPVIMDEPTCQSSLLIEGYVFVTIWLILDSRTCKKRSDKSYEIFLLTGLVFLIHQAVTIWWVGFSIEGVSRGNEKYLDVTAASKLISLDGSELWDISSNRPGILDPPGSYQRLDLFIKVLLPLDQE